MPSTDEQRVLERQHTALLRNAVDAIGLIGIPGQGWHLVVYLKVASKCIADAYIADASFQCQGCGATIALGSMLVDMIIDKPISECRAITNAELTETLEDLPPDKTHCAGNAVGALNQALDDWETKRAAR